MSMLEEDYARVRFGETDKVPLGPGIWFLVFTVKGTTLHFLEFRCTRQGLKEFEDYLCANMLTSSSMPPQEIRIFAVWHGQYRTDLFLMNPGELLGRIRLELNQHAAKKRVSRKGR